MVPVVIVHAGAGSVPAADIENSSLVRAGLTAAVATGMDEIENGAAAVCAAAVASMESHASFNAGVGSVLASDGGVWCDAAIMSGDGRAGAVAAIRGIVHPVRAADAIRREGRLVLWAGRSQELGARYGLETTDPSLMVTEHARRSLARHRDAPADSMGTVGAVCLDRAGNLAAATSTGGKVGKAPARVGDSAVIGAGTWASQETCAISATGDGEAFIRALFAHEVHARMRWGGQSLEHACAGAIELVGRCGGVGGAICLAANGDFALPISADLMNRGWQVGDGPVLTAILAGETPA